MRTKIVALVVAAAIGIGGAAVQVMTQQQPRTLDVQKVKDNLFVIFGPGGNVGVRITNEGVIVIDDKFEQDYANIIEKVKSVTSQPVKYVINTHQHGDHTGSNAQFLKIADIISHKNARDNMVKGNMPGLARIVFTDKTAVYLGGVEVQAHYLGRGHTNGDAIIYYPDLRVVQTGDIINEAGPFIDYTAGGSGIEWVTVLDNILKLDFDTAIPGHGKIMTKTDIAAWKTNLQTLQQRMTELIRSGAKKDEAAAKLSTQGITWQLTPQSAFMTRSLSGFFDEVSARR